MPLASYGFLVPDYVRSELGQQAFVPLSSPAAGATRTYKITGQYWEVPVNLYFHLVTSATVATRTVVINVFDVGGTGVDFVGAMATQAASLDTAYRFSLALTGAYQVGATLQSMPLLPYILPSGWQLQVSSFNLQAGDQFNQITLTVQRYETGPTEAPTVPLTTIPNDAISTASDASVPVMPGAAVSSSFNVLTSASPSGSSTPAPAPTVVPAPSVSEPALAPVSNIVQGENLRGSR